MPKLAVYSEELQLLGTVQVSQGFISNVRPRYQAAISLMQPPGLASSGPAAHKFMVILQIERLNMRSAWTCILICPKDQQHVVVDWLENRQEDIFIH